MKLFLLFGASENEKEGKSGKSKCLSSRLDTVCEEIHSMDPCGNY